MTAKALVLSSTSPPPYSAVCDSAASQATEPEKTTEPSEAASVEAADLQDPSDPPSAVDSDPFGPSVYAVTRGREIGVTDHWYVALYLLVWDLTGLDRPNVRGAVAGLPGAVFMAFATADLARDAWKDFNKIDGAVIKFTDAPAPGRECLNTST